MIELSDLTYLVSVKERGTLSSVAKALHVSQPVLTRRMQKLEEEFGVPLFERTKNKITLNEDGILAAGYARKILLQTENMVELVRTQAQVRSTISMDSSTPRHLMDGIQRTLQNYPEMVVSTNRLKVRMQNTFSIGACSYVPSLEILERFTRSYPDMEISLEIRNQKFLLEMLESGRYRAVILPYPVEKPDMVCVRCGEEHMAAALPVSHPLASREGIYTEELDGETVHTFPGSEEWLAFAGSKMPHSRIPVQPVNELLEDLYRKPELSFFTSDILDRQVGHPENRILMPMLDPEAAMTYYAVYRKGDRPVLEKFF